MYTDNFNVMVNGLDVLFDEIVRMAEKARNKPRPVKLNYGNGITIDAPDFCSEDDTPRCRCRSKKGSLFDGGILDDIDQVIFNKPATIVTFKDGTKVCVKACEKDTFSKETGLIYAIIKRLYANDVDENGYLKSTGLGEKINQIVENAFDQKEQEKALRAKRKAKAERKAAQEKAKEADEAGENAAKEAVEKVYQNEKND